MKTFSPKPRDIERRWYVLDASGAILGRLATQAASILRGKHKPIYAPHADTGDHVIVINAKDVALSGGKENKKVAYRHSGYPGGLTETVYSRLLAKKPAFAVEKAIRGMLPKNRLGRQMAGKLRVYEGADHRHRAQQPRPLALGEIPTWDGLPGSEGPIGEAAAPSSRSERSTSSVRGRTAKPTTAKRASAKSRSAGSAAGSSRGKTATGKDATAKRSAAKRSAAKRSTAKRSTAKRSTAKRSTAKRSTAKRSAGTRSTTSSSAKTSRAKKASAKRSSAATKKET